MTHRESVLGLFSQGLIIPEKCITFFCVTDCCSLRILSFLSSI